ncbi:MAG: tRNA pseudouridine(55) synthase TruB [Candidatus Korobacteraceae bacterium]|jgi:tRNA pseudouridine55 synthase
MAIDGILIVDKSAGMTSHDVVASARRICGERSVGHLGTLDPMATGVLPLVLGRMTRLAQFYQGASKAYTGEICFGTVTDSYDADGDPVDFEPQCPPQPLTLESVRAAAARFHGRMQQLPPPFSAKKIKGVPAYKLARRKVEVELKPVEVEIEAFVIESLTGNRADFTVVVSAGTYVRAIAHELGQSLGCGAHLSALRRTRCGEFRVEDAHSLDDIARRMATGAGLGDYLIHPRKILPHMPAVIAPPEAAGRVRNGGAVNLPEMSEAKLVKVFANQSELLAIASRIAGTLFQPKVVLAAASKEGK